MIALFILFDLVENYWWSQQKWENPDKDIEKNNRLHGKLGIQGEI